jgi:aspartate kinase
MIVMKFGGTSTQDAAAMLNVAGIVRDHLEAQPVVVISAIAQATNSLEKAGRLAAQGKREESLAVIRQLMDRHRAIVQEAVHDRRRSDHLRQVIADAARGLEELVQGVSIMGELTPRSLDRFYCYGEILSSHLVSAVLQEKGIESGWLDTKDFMITDESFNRAAPLMEEVARRLPALVGPLVEKRRVPVTQGFIGITETGARTTMGRESSDYSAAIIGAVLEAKDIQIWTDVDGVLTADPTVVPNPRKVRVLSFEEAYELSYFGAKVLHPNTMLPAIERNIPIHIYNSRRPTLSGTLVAKDSSHRETIVKSVASRRNVVLLSVSPLRRFSQYLFWEQLYSILTKYNVAAIMTATSEQNCSFVVDQSAPVHAIVHEIAEVGRVQVVEGKGIVCIVGQNIRHAPGILGRIFNALSTLGISMISFGASPSSLSLVIDDRDIPEAVQNIHREFFEDRLREDMFEMLTQP